MPAISKAQQEVWEWKKAAFDEVAHLDRREALKLLLSNAEKLARASRLSLNELSPSRREKAIAERRTEYGGKK